MYKRDLLKKRVVSARDEEKGAQQEFKDALTRLKELTNFEGGDLEKQYRQLQSNYDDASVRVAAVHKRIQDVETVAGDSTIAHATAHARALESLAGIEAPLRAQWLRHWSG